jgi:LuxR family transcriptional regulator, maltose regulon positive regulatory protein
MSEQHDDLICDFPTTDPWMWVGKFKPPQTFVKVIPRPALLDSLIHNLDHPLTLVVSAPGFGKTTLLAQCHEAMTRDSGGMPAAWLSLDRADAEVNRFLAGLLLALETAGLALGKLASLARQQQLDNDPKRTVNALLHQLSADGRRFLFILDDYHLAACAAVDAILVTLLEQAHPWLHFIVASRMKPAWPMAHLRTRAWVHELSAQDLTLSDSEIDAIFGQAVPRTACNSLHSITEGWAAAVQLARLWFTKSGAVGAGLESFSGRATEVAEYISEQILDSLPDDCRAFLLETSVLDRFNAIFADRVRGRSDSAKLMERLAHFRALLVPLDSGHTWFRYHLLLADFLRPRLDAERAIQLHRAAARAKADLGDLPVAVSHALMAGDTGLAIGLVREAGGWRLFLRHGVSYALDLLHRFDELTRRSDPTLVLMQSLLQARQGNRGLANELLHIAGLAAGDDASLRADIDVITAVVHAYFDQFDAHSDVPTTLEAAARQSPDPLAQASLLCAGAVCALALGKMQEVIRASQAARGQMRLVVSSVGEAYCIPHEALARALGGDLVQSRRLIDEALQLAEVNLGTESSLKSLVGCFKAQLLYWEGEWEDAQHLLDDARDVIENTDGWLDLFAIDIEVSWRTSLWREGLQSALMRLDRASQFAKDRDLQRLATLVNIWRVDLLAQCGFVEAAQREALAIALHDLAQTARGEAHNWRCTIAATLALGRLRLASGDPADAASCLRQGMASLTQHGLQLQAWRLGIMHLVARRRHPAPPPARADIEAVLEPVIRHGLSGLLLEAGPAILPVLKESREILPATLLNALKRLSGRQKHAPKQHSRLSSKEVLVVRLVVKGQSNKEIARNLGLSENTVKFHLKQIFQKLEVTNRAGAALVWSSQQ